MDDLREKHKNLVGKKQEIEKKLVEIDTKKKLAKEDIMEGKARLAKLLKFPVDTEVTIVSVEERLDLLSGEIEKRLKGISEELTETENEIFDTLSPSEETSTEPDDIGDILEGV